MDTLTLVQRPSINSNVSFKTRIIKNSFGDGYRQTVADGLNAVERTWNVNWAALPIVDADYLAWFFENHVGKPFLFTMPRETTPRKWDCDQWTRGYPAGGYDSFTATLIERYDLA